MVVGIIKAVPWKYKRIKRELVDVMVSKYPDIWYRNPGRVNPNHFPSKTIARMLKKEKYTSLGMTCSLEDDELLSPKERDGDERDERERSSDEEEEQKKVHD